jgi:UDP:flavonoid glycosyltransferase YjiC (YdhE family)
MAGAPAVACFVSPHGFGHAARAAAVCGALRDRVPGLRLHLFTTVPRWFFADSLAPGFALHRLETDVGVVQRGPLAEDLPATVARLAGLVPPPPRLLQALGRRLRRLGCAAVVCDIAPLGIAAARAAGLPAVLVENFTWDWIYRGLADREPRLRYFADELAATFRLADLRVQTEPVCRAVAGAVRVGPVCRRPRSTRAATRAALGVPARAPLVLVTMGGIPHGGFALETLGRAAGVHFVLAGAARRRRRAGNALLLPHRSGFFHPDLVAAADAVVGKLGYSTLAESSRAGVPFGFVPRPGFPESAVLERWVLRRGRGVRLAPDDFASGAWVRRLDDLLALGRSRERLTDGAAEAARLIADRYLRF